MRDNAYSLQDLIEALQDLLLYQLLSRDHPGGILSTSILEAIVFSRLQGLNPAAKVAGNDTEPGEALLLQDLDSINKWLNLPEVLNYQWCLLPPVIGNRPSIRMHNEGGLHISSVKPLGPLVLHRVDQSVFKELFLFVLMKLNPIPT
jgi:hypothetical protein